MRALVVAPQPFFSFRGTPLSVYYRTLLTAEMGVEIDFLTYGQGEDVEIPGVRIVRIPAFRFLGPVKIGPSVLKLFLDVFLVARTVAMLLRRRYDFVHAHEESVFFCRFLKPIFRFRLVYDMHSSLPRQLESFKFTTFKPVIWLFEKLENSCLRAADAVITISPELAEIAAPRLGPGTRHELIENTVFDEVRLSQKRPPSLAEEVAARIPAGRRIVAYAGSFEAYQGLDLLVDAFALLLESHDDVFLLMIGGSDVQVEQARRRAEAAGIGDHSLFTGRLDPITTDRLLERTAITTSPRTEGAVPLKIYKHLTDGRPFVATRIQGHTEVVSDDTAFLADPDPASFAAALAAALDDPELAARKTAAAKALYEKRYSRAVYERKLRRLLESFQVPANPARSSRKA